MPRVGLPALAQFCGPKRNFLRRKTQQTIATTGTTGPFVLAENKPGPKTGLSSAAPKPCQLQ
jgi:hypothetical protein